MSVTGSSLRKIQAFRPNFVVRKFSINGQFVQIVRQFTRKSAETDHLQKIFSPEH